MSKTKDKNKFTRVLEYISDYWPAFGLFFTIAGLLAGWLLYQVNPLQPLEEIAAKQAEYREKLDQKKFQDTMVERHLKLGNSFLDDSMYMAAKKEFDKAAGLDKMDQKAQLGLMITGVYELMQNEFVPQAIERQIDFILEVEPNDPHAHVLLGDLHVQLEDLDKAGDQYQQAIKFNGKTASAYFGLGVIYERQNDLDKALENYENAARLSKWNEQYLNNLASVQGKKGDYKSAIENYELVLTLDFEFLLPYLEISLAHRLMGDIENIKMSAKYLKKFLPLLSDEKVSGLDKNKGGWFFMAGEKEKKEVSLYDMKEKRCYALYNLSITLFLLNQGKEAGLYFKEARDLKIEQDATIASLALWDLRRFAEKHPAYKEQAEKYRKTYLPDVSL